MLWKIKNTPSLSFENTNKISLSEVQWHITNKPVKITARVDSLLRLAISQTFVPVIDDNDVFIGIVKRSDIIEYCADLLEKKEGKVG